LGDRQKGNGIKGGAYPSPNKKDFNEVFGQKDLPKSQRTYRQTRWE